jgi:trehalose 6-phosphate phosphatase
MHALDRLRAEPEHAAIVLDVDGVLAPIVARPEDAAIPEETRLAVRSLLDRYGLVAAVTGRPSADAMRMIDIPEVFVAGTHGLELETVEPEWIHKLHELARGTGWPFEDKGVALAFHYRTADDEAAARAQLETVAERARAEGLHARFGRKVLELLPPIEVNKGTAVRRLLERAGLSRALYAGDDTTDLDGFAALDELEVGVRVAVDSPEAPPGLRERADVVVDGPTGFLALLRTL